MDIDLTRITPGSTVRFRCGGEAIVERASGNDPTQISFGGGGCKLIWHATGRFSALDHPLDIVWMKIAPLSAERRLEIISDWCKPANVSSRGTQSIVDMIRDLVSGE